MSSLTESCACGATFTATANYMSDMRQQAEAFRDAHQSCRRTSEADETEAALHRVMDERNDALRRIDMVLGLCEEEIQCGGPGTNSLGSFPVRVRTVLTVPATMLRPVEFGFDPDDDAPLTGGSTPLADRQPTPTAHSSSDLMTAPVLGEPTS